jgi:hypothetical protein
MALREKLLGNFSKFVVDLARPSTYIQQLL